MARTFQIKRGAKSKMPTLAQAELGFVTDSGAEELYIGNGSQNIQIARQDYVDEQIANIPTTDVSENVFVATHGVTTSAELEAAYNAGKLVVCNNDGRFYVLTSRWGANSHSFSCPCYDYTLVIDVNSDVWGEVYYVSFATEDHSHNISAMTFLGENITAGSANDTTEFWANKESGRAWISSDGMLVDQPSTYGILINYTYAADVFQIFRSQSAGPTYFRSGNTDGWSGTWQKVPVCNENGELIIDGNVKGIYTIGEWLQTTADTHREEPAEKIAVLDGSGWVYHRTPAEALSDMGGATKPSMTKVTLATSSWNSSTRSQSVTVQGILADETKQLITVSPAGSSTTAATKAGVYCSSQAANSLTFACSAIPSENIVMCITWQDAEYV